MSILFIRFGWFILGTFFGAWVMYDKDRSSAISSSFGEGWISVSDLITSIANSMGF